MNLCKDKTVYAVKTTLISFSSKEEPIKSETEAKNKKSGKIFDTLQKLGKVLMVVIAVMPAAGLMISLGKLVGMIGGGDIAIIHTIGNVMENIGWAVINNLHILFAVAIGGSWAKERAGGAFAELPRPGARSAADACHDPDIRRQLYQTLGQRHLRIPQHASD